MSAAELRRTLARLAEIPEPALAAACKAVEEIAFTEGGSVVVRGRRYKLKAITRIKRGGNTITATVWGTPTGFWVWKNTGTSAHLIPKRPPTAKNPRPMHGGGYAHPIQRKQIMHPGTGGRGAWRKVVARAERIVPETIEKYVKGALRG